MVKLPQGGCECGNGRQPVDPYELAWALTTRTELSITNVKEIAGVSSHPMPVLQRTLRRLLESRGVDTLRISWKEARQMQSTAPSRNNE